MLELFSGTTSTLDISHKSQTSVFMSCAMSKRKAEEFSGISASNDPKKLKHDFSRKSETTLKSNLLVDSESSSSSEDESEAGGAPLEEAGFKISEEYAKRFEHNKKREELHRC
jgi:hypothetical protein